MDDLKQICMWCQYSRWWYGGTGLYCVKPENYLQNGSPAAVAADDACRLFEREPGGG